jgi:enediyne biosynthesis protein E3
MNADLGSLRKRLFGIAAVETSFARRGFRAGTAGARQRIEQIGQTFLLGYHAALEDHAPDRLAARLNAAPAEVRGFAFEGAAMALTLLDQLMPWRRYRLANFLRGPGAAHAYMVHVGAGWAFARLCWNLDRPLVRLDPLLRWLAIDGYGFHAGYFFWPRYVTQQAPATRLSGYARRVFDQGLGRSLWFVEGADVERIPARIAAFAPQRHGDLWSGVGLACAYAGGVDRSALETLLAAAADYQPDLAQGAAFAAKARQRASNPAAHTELACTVICAMSADDAAQITDAALHALPPDGALPAYEHWRQRIRTQLTQELVTS